jgi:hypothetical protein
MDICVSACFVLLHSIDQKEYLRFLIKKFFRWAFHPSQPFSGNSCLTPIQYIYFSMFCNTLAVCILRPMHS